MTKRVLSESEPFKSLRDSQRDTIHVHDSFTPVLVVVLGETTTVRASSGKFFLLYELMITNAHKVDAVLDTLEVLDDKQDVLFVFTGPSLLKILTHLDTRPVTDATIGPDTSRLAFINVCFEQKEQIPVSIVHRITVSAATRTYT